MKLRLKNTRTNITKIVCTQDTIHSHVLINLWAEDKMNS